MTDDVEQRLEQLRARGADPTLRERVLRALTGELAKPAAQAGLGRVGFLVAAALALGVLMNAWAVQADQARQARLLGPAPIPRPVAEIAQAVESVTDAETARWVEQQFSKIPARPGVYARQAQRIEEMIHVLEKS